jgi:hypothetical protein
MTIHRKLLCYIKFTIQTIKTIQVTSTALGCQDGSGKSPDAEPVEALPVFIVFKSDSVYERFKALRDRKITEFAPAAVANGQSGYFMVEQPICQGENRQAQTVCPGHQDDPYTHNDKTNDLVEILVRIELPACAHRAAFKNTSNGLDLTENMAAMQAFEFCSIGNFTDGVFFTLIAKMGKCWHIMGT